MMLRNMSMPEATRARGRLATLTVIRDGVRIVRSGPPGHVTPQAVFDGVFCYHRDEVPDLDVEEER